MKSILTNTIIQILSLTAPQHPKKPTKVITAPTIINNTNNVHKCSDVISKFKYALEST